MGWTVGARDFYAVVSRVVCFLCFGPTQPYIQWVLGFSTGVKLTPSTKCRSQECWTYTSTPPYVLMVCLFMHSVNFANLLSVYSYVMWKLQIELQVMFHMLAIMVSVGKSWPCRSCRL